MCNDGLIAARHSMATIAINKAGIPIYVVNEMLCHVDSRLRVTELYIQKDYSIINEANFALIDYVFKHKETTLANTASGTIQSTKRSKRSKRSIEEP